MNLGPEIVGWRAWRVVETPLGLRLASVLYDDLWEPGRVAVAHCEHHDPPAAGCACGFHAAKDREAALPYLVGRDERGTVDRVLGLVALYGRVIEHEHGWRAERAYPLSFWRRAALRP